MSAAKPPIIVVKQACELRTGDIIDARGMQNAFGYVYHIVLSTPKFNHDKKADVHVDCAVVDRENMKPRRRDYYGWPLHLKSSYLVRVWNGAQPPAQVEKTYHGEYDTDNDDDPNAGSIDTDNEECQ